MSLIILKRGRKYNAISIGSALLSKGETTPSSDRLTRLSRAAIPDPDLSGGIQYSSMNLLRRKVVFQSNIHVRNQKATAVLAISFLTVHILSLTSQVVPGETSSS